jgi:hypothetical protein
MYIVFEVFRFFLPFHNTASSPCNKSPDVYNTITHTSSNMKSFLALSGALAIVAAQAPPAPVLLTTTKSGVLPVIPTATPGAAFTGVETIEGAITYDGPANPGFTVSLIVQRSSSMLLSTLKGASRKCSCATKHSRALLQSNITS